MQPRQGEGIMALQRLAQCRQRVGRLVDMGQTVGQGHAGAEALAHPVQQRVPALALALAVAEGYIPGAYAFELSRIDETYQAEKWGADDEAVKRAAALAHELDKAVELIAAVH